jgi:hypothetical protein
MRLLPATTAALLLLLAGLLLEPASSPVPAPRGLPLGHGADPRLTELLVEISDWIVTIGVGSNDLALSCSSFWCTRVPSFIFVNGNLARVLLAAHTVTGNDTYLDEGLQWCDAFVREKHTITTSAPSPLAMGTNHTTGAWWDSGYGTIYFGDTGTAHQALGLCAVKLPLGNERRAQYIMAMREYGAFVQAGCVQHVDMSTAPTAATRSGAPDLHAKAKVMRSLGLSAAAIQAAFDVDWPHAATTATTALPPLRRPVTAATPLPCPGGILKCPAGERGWIGEGGAVGDGWVHGATTLSPYSCSTATTGAGSFGENVTHNPSFLDSVNNKANHAQPYHNQSLTRKLDRASFSFQAPWLRCSRERSTAMAQKPTARARQWLPKV